MDWERKEQVGSTPSRRLSSSKGRVWELPRVRPGSRSFSTSVHELTPLCLLEGVAVGSEEAPVTYADRMREKALKRFNS